MSEHRIPGPDPSLLRAELMHAIDALDARLGVLEGRLDEIQSVVERHGFVDSTVLSAISSAHAAIRAATRMAATAASTGTAAMAPPAAGQAAARTDGPVPARAARRLPA
ncbi:hypothetical protein M0638_00950 [Roseomonas sp. NAR14]|uniref:Uncharacterized protein n=1 Tax=Roseomonas acroporae TaxID=2937791 RepID=A0A9X1Y491_9PROT|nr:hypothetical protein [Roseomonas acroporae]MCK8782948.1 hypothetical protein [Roseomonas acroporae]